MKNPIIKGNPNMGHFVTPKKSQTDVSGNLSASDHLRVPLDGSEPPGTTSRRCLRQQDHAESDLQASTDHQHQSRDQYIQPTRPAASRSPKPKLPGAGGFGAAAKQV